MKNKIAAIALAVLTAISSSAVLSGCGNDDFPVEVANFTISKEPENIVILDPVTADIVSYIGYDVKMCGRSDEVNQENLSIVPSVGTAQAPNVNDIISYQTDIVFADETINTEAQSKIEESGIKVIKMSQAKTETQLQTNYLTIGKILGGEITGATKGTRAYNTLLSDMEEMKDAAKISNNKDILYTVCYLYTENGELKIALGNTYINLLLENTGAQNIAEYTTGNSTVEPEQMRAANPNFIFYADEDTLNLINNDPILKSLNAVKNKNMLCISPEEINRQGNTALDTLKKMLDFIYPSDQTPATNVEGETQPTTVSAESVSVAEDYGIKIDNETSFKKKDQNDNVKAMQKRLFDLGYIDDDENVTGYYGDITEQALKNFQKKSGMEQTGKADNKTLKALFTKDAPKAK